MSWNGEEADRRKHVRLSVYDFMTAAVAVWSYDPADGLGGCPDDCWKGTLADISPAGAQMVVAAGCQDYLKVGQHVVVRITNTIRNREVNVRATVRSFTNAAKDGTVCLRAQFVNLDSNLDAERIIDDIFQLALKLQTEAIATD